MRKILILAILVLTAVIAGILLIRDDWQNPDLTRKTTKVGLLLNGSRSDRSFSQTHYDALESLRDELNLESSAGRMCQPTVTKISKASSGTRVARSS